jgi:hypothetical protein
MMLVLVIPAPTSAQASGEWQIRPFAALTFGGGTTLLNLDQGAGKLKGAIGVGAGLVGEVFGWEADLGHSPWFFESDSGPQLVTESRVTTLTGNIIVGAPRTATEYTLRPYFVGGLGLMHAYAFDSLSTLTVSMTRPAFNVGGGVFGALSDRTGLSWELRHFRSMGQGEPRGQSAAPDDAAEKLSFWRANMALVIRY